MLPWNILLLYMVLQERNKVNLFLTHRLRMQYRKGEGGMRNKIISVILIFAMLIFSTCVLSTSIDPKHISASDKPAAYLATFVAEYEYNMEVEHAQFPSGNCTDNRRTDVLYYAVSLDGVTYTGLNNDRPVLYPYDMCKLGTPSLFRKDDGTYGLIAGVDNNSDKIYLSETDDLITFRNDRVVRLNNKGITVKNPAAEYDSEAGRYSVRWEDGNGKSYVSYTSDFVSFSVPEADSYKKCDVNAKLPVYAKIDETSIFELNADEYDNIMKKYGEIKSVSVGGLSQTVTAGAKVTLPETLNVMYSDGSVTSMGVDWNTAGAGLNFDSAQAGTYNINGTLRGTTVYNSPVAEFRADPFILYNDKDGYYYLTGSYMQSDLKNAYDYVIIRRARTINDLTDAEEVKIFSGTTKAESGVNVTPDYWAPEIHMIDGKYRILVQGTVDGVGRQCVLTCDDGDLMNPESWSYTGYIQNTTDNQQIGPFDTTYFEYEGQGYYVTQHTRGGSKLDITTVDPSDPLTPTGPRVSIAVPDRAYENNIGTGQSILEGPAALIHEGRVYVTYSGATIDMHYCTNLVYADLDSDLMNPDSWIKLQAPLFTTADVTTTVKDSVLDDGDGRYEGLMGPGHSNFTVDENGNPLLVYHARDWGESYATGSDKYGLSDPGRHAYVKCVHFGADGLPILNMTPDQILSDELRSVTVTVTVVDSTASNQNQNQNTDTGAGAGQQGDNPAVSGKLDKGYEFTAGGLKYKVISAALSGKKGKAALTGAAGKSGKNVKSVNVKSSVKVNGVSFNITEISDGAFKNYKKLSKVTVGSKVTKIGKNAFSGCRKLKNIVVKSKVLKMAGKNSFKNVHGFASVKVPFKKAAAYKKLLKKAGLRSNKVNK